MTTRERYFLYFLVIVTATAGSFLYVDRGSNDIWFSGNGRDWEKTESDPSWLGRKDHGVVVFHDKIWVTGGMDASWTWRNDIWHSTLN